MNAKRPATLTIAIILLALLSLGNMPAPFEPGVEKIPPPVVYGAVVLGIMGLFAVNGLWKLKRWGIVLTIIVSVLNALSAAPGIAAAPNGLLHVLATLYVVLSIVIIVLVVLPATRKAYAEERAHGMT
jgi:hypothetical protein